MGVDPEAIEAVYRAPLHGRRSARRLSLNGAAPEVDPELPGDLDWLDVVRRARALERAPRSGRRRALLLAAALLAPLALAGAALALTGSSTGVPAIDRVLNRAGPSAVDPGEPFPRLQPRAGSVSEPFEFTVDDMRSTAVGFRDRDGGICTAMADPESGGPPRDGGVSCLSARLLRDALAERAVEIFAGVGGRYLRLVGVARADVERIDIYGSTGHTQARLSPPWSPDPWNGAPIRFLYVLLDSPAGRLTPGDLFSEDLRIQAQLAGGRAVEVQR